LLTGRSSAGCESRASCQLPVTPSERQPAAARRRRRLRIAAIGVPPALLVLLLAAGTAATCRPAWYQPPFIDYSRLEEDKHAQLRLENRISAALNSGRPVDIELDESQANRWIAARAELWPGDVPSIEPFLRPQVEFQRGNRIRLGTLLARSGVEVVLSVSLHVALQGDSLVISWDTVRAGLLPAPAGLLERALREVAGKLNLREGTVLDGELVLPAESTWPNGARRFRVEALEIVDGILRARLMPM